MKGNSHFAGKAFTISASLAPVSRLVAFQVALLAVSLAVPSSVSALEGAEGKERDSYDTGRGVLEITLLGHSSLALEYRGFRIYIDPVKQYGDFAAYPKADLILITHEHGDHLDPSTIMALRKVGSRIVLNESSRKKLGSGETLEHGQSIECAGVSVLAVPAYNISPGRAANHPRARADNGYIIGAGTMRIYVAGDTEPIPEMEGFGEIDIAFLPMNLPYTMTPEQVAAASRTIRPKILYPYHFGTTDTSLLGAALAGDKDIEIRLRKMR